MRVLRDLLRFSPKVPTGALPLAWMEIPEPTPQTNCVQVPVWRYLAGGNHGVYFEYSSISASNNVQSNSYPAPTGNVLISGNQEVRYLLGFSAFVPVVEGVEVDDTGAWRPVLRDGVFVRRGYKLTLDDISNTWISSTGLSVGSVVDLVYTLPPWQLQSVNPTGDFYSGPADILSHDEVRVPLHPLVSSSIYSIESLVVNGSELIPAGTSIEFDESGVVTSALPTGVVEANGLSGVLRINTLLTPVYSVSVKVTRRVRRYMYRGYFEYNPSGSSLVYRDLDLNPEMGHGLTDSSGRRVSFSDLGSLLVKLYLVPSAVCTVTSGSTSITRQFYSIFDYSGSYDRASLQLLRWDYSKIDPGAFRYSSSKITLYTFGTCNYGSARFMDASSVPADQDFIHPGLKNVPCAAVLAEFYINLSTEAPYVVDARRLGGGLSEDISIEDLEISIRDQVRQYWDISSWDGRPVILAGTIVVEIPASVLVDNGGSFTRDEVERIVRRYTPLGVFPIIRFV
jgi:hypothetical protein